MPTQPMVHMPHQDTLMVFPTLTAIPLPTQQLELQLQPQLMLPLQLWHKAMLLQLPLKHMLLQLLVKLLTNLLTLAHKLSSLKLSSLKLYNPLMFKLNH